MSLPTTQRVINWNAQRYDQVYDYNLACRLLLEETEELFQATSVVEKMDAIGDICFVAIGVFWKLGFTNQQIYDMLYVHDLRSVTMEEAHNCTIWLQSVAFDIIGEKEEEGVYPGFTLALFSLFIVALGALRGLGLQNLFYEILHAICDSNDTKAVQGKVASNVKANTTKGLGYVPPTAKLFELYNMEMKKRSLN